MFVPRLPSFLPIKLIRKVNTVMAKHKATDSVKEQIQEIRVHWSESGRDRKVWPEYTVLTEENFEAILEELRAGGAKDVLEIKVGKAEE